jgi:hypothetical protein
MQKIVRILFMLSLLSSVTCQSALSSGKHPMIDEQMVKCAKNAWQKQAGKVESSWVSQVTPTLPNEWPPKKGLLLVAYGYLFRFPDHGADFVHNAGPFCKVVFDPAKPDTPQISAIAYDLKQSEDQGFHPIEVNADTYKSVTPILVEISKGKTATATDLQVIKRYYLFWRSNNGVIAQRIEKYHKDFFAWLVQK